MSTRFLNSFLDLFFPQKCLFCQLPQNASSNPNGVVCKNCLSRIRLNSWTFCPTCNKKTPVEYQKDNQACRKHRHAILNLGVAVDYNDPYLKELIFQYKYGFDERIGPILAEIIYQYFENVKTELLPKKANDWKIAFIPLTAKKQRWRGFNQSEIIAKKFSEKSGFDLFNPLLRCQNRQPQARTGNKKNRIANIKGSFSVSGTKSCRNKKFILIDDVCATGTTLIEAASILRKNGADLIVGLVLARKS